jgi:alanine dehydrogenase
MIIGIPKEIKTGEQRVSLLADQVKILVDDGHTVLVESNAGHCAFCTNEEYSKAGAVILNSHAEVFNKSELIVKVKEILQSEYSLLRPSLIIVGYLHTAANKEETDQFLQRHITSFSAEEMFSQCCPSAVLAGEIGALEGIALVRSCSGIHCINYYNGIPLKVVVLGLGTVGQGALRTTINMGCCVRGFNQSSDTVRAQTNLTWYKYNFVALPITQLHDYLYDCNLIINCVKWDKTRNDHLIYQSDLGELKKNCVIVDISCDKHGAVETCSPTTWEKPTYSKNGVCHFCVDNIPSIVPVTASQSYAACLIEYIRQIASLGVMDACVANSMIKNGLTTHNGHLILSETGLYQRRNYVTLDKLS